jgi:hypothetical protein
MILECRSQSIDCIESSRRDVIERPPMVGDEVSGVESLEKGQRITAREVTLSKSGLPPRRMPDGQEGQVQVPSLRDEVVWCRR